MERRYFSLQSLEKYFLNEKLFVILQQMKKL